MRLPRVRYTVRSLMLITLSVGIVFALSRHRDLIRRRAGAEHHGMRAETYRGRIPNDLRNGLICLKLAVEGEPEPMPFVNNSNGDCAEQQYHKTLIRMRLDKVEIPGPRPVGASTWLGELAWWIGEAGRDWARSTWHRRMKEKYERAAGHPWEPILPDPPKPFDDGW